MGVADAVRTARRVFEQFLPKGDPQSITAYDAKAKDPKAEAAGRKGGRKGGPVMAQALPNQTTDNSPQGSATQMGE